MNANRFLTVLAKLVETGKVVLVIVPNSTLIRDEQDRCPLLIVAHAETGIWPNGPWHAGQLLKLGNDWRDIEDGSDFPAPMLGKRAGLVRRELERLVELSLVPR